VIAKQSPTAATSKKSPVTSDHPDRQILPARQTATSVHGLRSGPHHVAVK